MIFFSHVKIKGGVLDVFYPKWKMKIATNELLFKMTCQLWKEAYCCGCYEEGKTSLEEELASEMCDSSEFTPQKSIDSLNELEKCSNNEECVDESTLGKQNGLDNNVSFKWHPFGKFDCNKGYMVSLFTLHHMIFMLFCCCNIWRLASSFMLIISLF